MSTSETAEKATRVQYASAGSTPEAASCCLVEYDPKHLEVIPDGLIDKDSSCF